MREVNTISQADTRTFGSLNSYSSSSHKVITTLCMLAPPVIDRTLALPHRVAVTTLAEKLNAHNPSVITRRVHIDQSYPDQLADSIKGKRIHFFTTLTRSARVTNEEGNQQFHQHSINRGGEGTNSLLQ